MYLTRNQAGVYSASGVRIPPSPPDKEKGLPNGSPFSLSGAGHDALCARRPTRCCATRGPLPSPASPRPCRGSPSTEGLVPPDCLRESTPSVDAHRDLRRSDHVLIWRGTRRALRASPHTLLRNAWAPPFAGLSPPLSGQPLNRGAWSSRWITGDPRGAWMLFLLAGSSTHGVDLPGISVRTLRVNMYASPAGAFPHDR